MQQYHPGGGSVVLSRAEIEYKPPPQPPSGFPRPPVVHILRVPMIRVPTDPSRMP